MSDRVGGHVVVDGLIGHGVDICFGVAGESYLAVLDGLYQARDRIRYVGCRNEGGAAMMADAYAKLTGRPGVCLVTRGPGACNASPGIHVASQDSTPVILLVGQVGTDAYDREAFQEIDYRQMFGQLAKWVAQVDRADRIPEYLSRAFHVATAGRPGPVVLALPEDVLAATVDVDDLPAYSTVRPHAAEADLEHLQALVGRAERPFALLGGGGWSARAAYDAQSLFESWNVPVGASFRCQDYIDNRSAVYAGDIGVAPDPAVAARLSDADLLLVLGPRLGEVTTSGYELIRAPRPKQRLIHVHAGGEELNSVFRSALAIHADVPATLTALRELPPLDGRRYAGWTAACNAAYQASREPLAQPGPFNLGIALRALRERYGDDVIATNGAGNYSVWVHRYWQYRGYRTQLAPTSGSMGYGVPAAVAAKLADPAREVVAFAGDGCFLMNGQEMATAAQEDLPFVTLVVNNGMLGTIRMHQERQYPARVVGTTLRNPDFAGLARAYGGYGEAVSTTGDLLPAVERARESGLPAIVEIQVSSEALTIRATLAATRAAAQTST